MAVEWTRGCCLRCERVLLITSPSWTLVTEGRRRGGSSLSVFHGGRLQLVHWSISRLRCEACGDGGNMDRVAAERGILFEVFPHARLDGRIVQRPQPRTQCVP